MNNRRISILEAFGNSFIIDCICESRIMYSYTTDQLYAIPIIVKEWITFGTNEDKMNEILDKHI